MTEPQIALTTAERALRQLMESAYSRAFGADWLGRVAGDEKPGQWSARLESERTKSRTRGEVAPSERLLDYANLYDLLTIVGEERNWGPLSPALGRQRSFTALLGYLEQLRDPIAHSRPLLPFQRDLVSGIAGFVRNKVTIYMSAQDDHGEYFARIESVRDRFAHEVSGSPSPDGSIGGCHTEQTLHVGEIVDVDCTGWDAQNRTLHWQVLSRNRKVAEGFGNEVTLSWQVGDLDVGGGDCTVHIRMWPEGAQHRRYPEGGSDGRAFFYYKVLPSAG